MVGESTRARMRQRRENPAVHHITSERVSLGGRGGGGVEGGGGGAIGWGGGGGVGASTSPCNNRKEKNPSLSGAGFHTNSGLGTNLRKSRDYAPVVEKRKIKWEHRGGSCTLHRRCDR